MRTGRRPASQAGLLRRAVLSLAGLAMIGTPHPASGKDRSALRVIFVDVEGGAATLFVTPRGHALLIDTGWPDDFPPPRAQPDGTLPPTSAQRIAQVARREGLSRIDAVLITHYHVDHVGGLAALMKLMPVAEVIDHGDNREPMPPSVTPAVRPILPAMLYPRYLETIARLPRRTMKPGDTFTLDGLEIAALDSGGEIPQAPATPTRQAAHRCANASNNTPLPANENPHSLGTVVRWGKVRILALGDSTQDIEARLVCPRDLIGRVDVMIADNHGSANAGNPALLDTVRPRIMVFNNGPTKGADAASLTFAATAPYVKSVWQMHYAERSPAANTRPDHIANHSPGGDAMASIVATVHRDGRIAITAAKSQ